MSTKLAKRSTAVVMSGFMIWTGLLASTATASVISTDKMVAEYSESSERAEMKAVLASEDVRARLMELGVSPADVEARIDSLTPTELAMLHERMDELPAGAGAGGLLLLLVLIFFITDILGVTDIFPFVNAAK